MTIASVCIQIQPLKLSRIMLFLRIVFIEFVDMISIYLLSIVYSSLLEITIRAVFIWIDSCRLCSVVRELLLSTLFELLLSFFIVGTICTV